MDQQIIVVVVVGIPAKKYARLQAAIIRISVMERWSEIIFIATNRSSAVEVAMIGVQPMGGARMNAMDAVETSA
jgi:hypothetical protein